MQVTETRHYCKHVSCYYADAVGIVTHELLHNMGMLHTHTRLDRGEHVHVNYLNVLPDKWIDYSWNPLQFPLDTEYDCDSIMHYRDTSFNIGNSITLEVSFLLLWPSVKRLEPVDGHPVLRGVASLQQIAVAASGFDSIRSLVRRRQPRLVSVLAD